MGNKTLTRMDLSEAVFEEVGLSRNESAQLVESVLDHMSDALVAGEQGKISSFGTFSIRDKSALAATRKPAKKFLFSRAAC